MNYYFKIYFYIYKTIFIYTIMRKLESYKNQSAKTLKGSSLENIQGGVVPLWAIIACQAIATAEIGLIIARYRFAK